MNVLEIEIKLAELKEQLQAAPPEKRFTIEMKARVWKTAKLMLELGKNIKAI